MWEKVFGEADFFLLGGGGGVAQREGDETLPERSSEVTERLALCELSERSRRFSFFSLCLSASRPRSLPSFGCFSSDFSLFLCLFLCFFPTTTTTGRSNGTGGGGLGVRGPFFLLWLPLVDLLGTTKQLINGFLMMLEE